MDMKKILQAFDGAAEKKPVQGASDMKKFVSIVRESASPYTPATEAVITSFEAGSIGGDANTFLLAADKIQDEVMAQVNRIKINADEANLRDMMDKFNAFMTAYHNVGKEILQPDMFNDKMGESTVGEAFGRKDAYQRDYDSSVSGMDKHQSRAYQADGGANDEGWGEEPRSSYQGGPQAKTRMVGMFFYNVQPGQEQEAASLGVKQTKSGKWAKTKYNTSGRTFGMQKDLADKAFGVGKWWAPKTESVEQGVEEASWVNGKLQQPEDLVWKQTSLSYEEAVNKYGKDAVRREGKNRLGQEVIAVHVPLGGTRTPALGVAEGSAHGYNVAKWYEKNGDQLKLTKWLRKEAGLPKDAKVYFDDADLVYGDQTIVPSALVNKSLKFNDLLTALMKAAGGTPKEKVDGVYRTSDVAEGLSFKDYVNLAEANKGLE
jgi:hypothetical protein